MLAGTTSVDRVLAVASQLHPDVVLVDVALTGAVAALAAAYPSLPLIAVISAADARDGLEFAIDQHVAGVVLDPSIFEHVQERPTKLERVGFALNAAAAGGSWLEPTLWGAARALIRRRTPSVASRMIGFLTLRETEVLDLVVNGSDNKEIADRLSIGERTVKHHLSSLIRKFQARDRAHLIALYYRG